MYIIMIIILLTFQVVLTMWGKEAENFEGNGNPVIAVKVSTQNSSCSLS